MVNDNLKTKIICFNFDTDEKNIRNFIKENFTYNTSGTSYIEINANNITSIYHKWVKKVKPSIKINWKVADEQNIYDVDFFVADIFTSKNETIKDGLYATLKNDCYKVDRVLGALGGVHETTILFNDNQVAHKQFWNIYKRPPKEKYWDYIIERRDKFLSNEARERKGAYFTPPWLVELSQQYLTDTLGDKWQDEYYIWDCAAGTGNLLKGLTNKYNIWASTLDRADVAIMKDKARNGANLLESHIFQFDFLNDDFSKCPQELQDIINNCEERKKLVIYINPPYVASGTKSQMKYTGFNKKNVIFSSVKSEYKNLLKKSADELYVQFFSRIKFQLDECILGSFSKIKHLTSESFMPFRRAFGADYKSGFICLSTKFENTKTTRFPVAFLIFRLIKNSILSDNITVDILDDSKSNKNIRKRIVSYESVNTNTINKWLQSYNDVTGEKIGILMADIPEFSSQNPIALINNKLKGHRIYMNITINNLIPCAVFFAVRHVIKASWLNDKDLFFTPCKTWEDDIETQYDCLTFTIFHHQNRLTSENMVNNWIPFTEYEINAKNKFKSHFMTDYINGKLYNSREIQSSLLSIKSTIPSKPIMSSPAARTVFDAGRDLWKYYHSQENINPNASLYDIKLHFQGVDEKGEMNHKSDDAIYTKLLDNLKECLKKLAEKIEPKIYEHRFLIQ